MSQIDLVFEGGGVKGVAHVGALDVLFSETSHTFGRLLGTSAGAITAVLLAAGYTIPDMLAALAETDAEGHTVFGSFLATPPPVDKADVQRSAIRKLLRDLDLPFVPDFAEEPIDNWIADQIADNDYGRHLMSFVDRGGWFSADPFVDWLKRKLNEGNLADGRPRNFGALTLDEFFQATNVEMTLVAADTVGSRMLLLNHNTAPKLPVVWATRMSMSIPLLWQEVVWDSANWGGYQIWNADENRMDTIDMTAHTIVDGGVLSNFPISLFLADRADISAVVGPPRSKNVLGLLLDDAIEVANRPPRAEDLQEAINLSELSTVQRLQRLVGTTLGAHDNTAIAVFGRHVVHLPAGGYSTIQFDMTDDERNALVESGRAGMRKFLSQQTVLELAGVEPEFGVDAAAQELANEAAPGFLR